MNASSVFQQIIDNSMEIISRLGMRIQYVFSDQYGLGAFLPFLAIALAVSIITFSIKGIKALVWGN